MIIDRSPPRKGDRIHQFSDEIAVAAPQRLVQRYPIVESPTCISMMACLICVGTMVFLFGLKNSTERVVKSINHMATHTKTCFVYRRLGFAPLTNDDLCLSELKREEETTISL